MLHKLREHNNNTVVPIYLEIKAEWSNEMDFLSDKCEIRIGTFLIDVY